LKLRAKTSLIIIATLIISFTVFFLLTWNIYSGSIKKIEELTAHRNVERALNAFSQEVMTLSTLVEDWSVWDDSYEFIEDGNSEYIKSNLVDVSFVTNRLNIMVYINRSGQIIFGKHYDLDTKTAGPVPDTMTRTFYENPNLVYHSDIESYTAGLIATTEGPMLICSRPILTSDFKGPVRGSLLMGRYLSNQGLKKLSEITHLNLAIQNIEAFRLSSPGLAGQLLTKGSEEKTILIQPQSEETITGYAILNDISGKPGFVLYVDMPREVYLLGKESMLFFALFSFLTGLVLIAAFIVLLEKKVLSRLVKIIESVKTLGSVTNSNSRIPVEGDDELTGVAIAINNMLDNLESSQNEVRENEKRFKYMSYHDSLTGLYNRTYFDEQLVRLNKNFSNHLPLSIITIDIDGLKLINDTFGHKAGDTLLQTAARFIKAPFRKSDIVARIGGDEFCAILPGVDHTVALDKKDKIMDLVDKYNSGNPTVPLSMSIGIATSHDLPDETIYDIFQRADDNMYSYKLNQTESQKSKVIEMLLAALVERDFIAQGHIERLVLLSEKMAEKLHLRDEEKQHLILLAKVHDLGKVGIPDDILFKQDKLTGKEYEKMKEHSRIGYNIASRSKELSHIAELILHHHEHWNGKGYPGGLRGEQIPVECRILNIIDAFDAMTNIRPYNNALSVEEAIAELQRCSGSQFQPELVEVFISILSDELKKGTE